MTTKLGAHICPKTESYFGERAVVRGWEALDERALHWQEALLKGEEITDVDAGCDADHPAFNLAIAEHQGNHYLCLKRAVLFVVTAVLLRKHDARDRRPYVRAQAFICIIKQGAFILK